LWLGVATRTGLVFTAALSETAGRFDRSSPLPRPTSLSDALQDTLSGAVIVFDLDGTLVDTAPDLVGALNLVLAQENLPSLPLDECRTMIGHGARALIARGFAAVGAPIDEPRMDALEARFIDFYVARIAAESRPFPGALEAMDVLAAAGAKLAVCTNKRTSLSLALLDALNLTTRFAAIVGGDAVTEMKPAACHLLTTIARAGGDPRRAVMVGDAGTDAGAARAAGTPLVLVSFGYNDVPVADLKADILIDHFDQLPGACERLLSAGLSAPA
jgi:phosphoglycolate phosphatase